MIEKAKVAFDVAQRASSDPDFMRNLVQNPVEAVLKVDHSLKKEEAEEVAAKAAEQLSTLPGLEITNLVKEVIRHATSAFKLTIRLSQILFYVGIGILAGVLAFEIVGRILGEPSWQNVATTGIVGAVGVGTVISSFILRPLQNIQNSVGNLSQIEIGFLSFIDRRQLLLQTKTTKNINNMKKLSDEIAAAATSTTKLIEKYCEYRPEASGDK